MTLLTSDDKNRLSSLRRVLWKGTVLVNAILLATCAVFWPDLLLHLAGGMILGGLTVWSLFFLSDQPLAKGQALFSLFRMAGVAYLIVQLSGGKILEATVVICGLLSYKIVLMFEALRQSIPQLLALAGCGSSNRAK